MLKLFKIPFLSKTSEVERVSHPLTIVQQIHAEVDSIEDLLIQEANELINPNLINKDVLKKAERLKNLGFTSSSVVLSVEEETKVIQVQLGEIEKKKKLNGLVLYYKRTYPWQKFLTLEKFEEICKKYGLIYASVSRYLRDVPEKNLKEIENIKPLKTVDQDNEEVFIYITNAWSTYSGYDLINKKKFSCSFQDFSSYPNIDDKEVYNVIRKHIPNLPSATYIFSKAIVFKENKSGLYIAAPKVDFNLNDFELNANEIGYLTEEVIKELKDPIVFRFCKGGIQVISKWGLEARDEALVNPIEN
jgi:hypothetical protein